MHKEVFFVLSKQMRKNEALLRKVVVLSLLSAMSIVLGKFLAIPWGDILRFSLESMPIFFVAFVYGPVESVAVALVADLLGCVLRGYAINPIVTLGGVVLALVASLSFRLFRRLPNAARYSLPIVLGHLLGSVVVKTFGLAAFYSIGPWELMLWRLLNYVIVALMDGAVIFALFKSNVPYMATGKKNDRK